MNEPILTHEEFLNGEPFYVLGEPHKVYRYFKEPLQYGQGFIAQNHKHIADVVAHSKEGFAYSVITLGGAVVHGLKFELCVNYHKSSQFTQALKEGFKASHSNAVENTIQDKA
jgi:hypothetical protein